MSAKAGLSCRIVKAAAMPYPFISRRNFSANSAAAKILKSHACNGALCAKARHLRHTYERNQKTDNRQNTQSIPTLTFAQPIQPEEWITRKGGMHPVEGWHTAFSFGMPKKGQTPLFSPRLCEAKCMCYALPALPLQMLLPPEVRAFEAAGKQGCDCVLWSHKRKSGFINAYESLRPTSYAPTYELSVLKLWPHFRK